jgi:protein-S-isoprenylcysteine O-methyltransferase Ste14
MVISKNADVAQCAPESRVHSTVAVSRRQLARAALPRLAGAVVILPALLVLSAGTFEYWEAWTYLAILLIPMMLTAGSLLARDPELLERRLRTGERDPAQIRIVALAGVVFLAILLIPGFDRRFGWSSVPPAAVVAADLVVLLAYGLFILVLRENRSVSRIIEVESGQRVVTTGPYAVVRHPMYAAVTLIGAATPVALGSWWALIPVVFLVAVLTARIRNEERVLAQELSGYREYMRTTSYRLIPGVW